MKIHTVVGERGEYSDWTTWVAAGFFRKDNAESHAKRLNEIVATFLAAEYTADEYEEQKRIAAELSAADPAGYPPSDFLYVSCIYPPKYRVGSIDMKDKP